PYQIAHLYPEGPSNPHREKALAAFANKGDAFNGATIRSKSEVSTASTKVPGQANPQALAKEKKSPEELSAALSDKMIGSLMEDDSEPPTIKLGDASVAAPFTSKLANVVAIAN